MKSHFLAAAIFSLLLLTIPAAPMVFGKTADFTVETDENSIVYEITAQETNEKSGYNYDTIKYLDITTGQVDEISAFDYVVGAVSAEMPATFEPEALKAQAVAAYTYAVRQAVKAETSPEEELCGAYFSNDTSKYQAFFTENQIKQYYGDNYEEYIKKIKKAVEDVYGLYITYEGEPIIAAFHSVSTGKTESAENVWGSKIPYLTAVESKYDTKSPKFIQEYEFSQNEIKSMLSEKFPQAEFSENPENWFDDFVLSESGTVLSLTAGGVTLTGQQLRSVLSLCSASFEIKYEDGFIITTKGCGHCVGMSRYGANEMAKTGLKYDEILAHYYPDTKIIS